MQVEKIESIITGVSVKEGIEKLLNKYSPVGQSVDGFRKAIHRFMEETDDLLESYSKSLSNLHQESIYATLMNLTHIY